MINPDCDRDVKQYSGNIRSQYDKLIDHIIQNCDKPSDKPSATNTKNSYKLPIEVQSKSKVTNHPCTEGNFSLERVSDQNNINVHVVKNIETDHCYAKKPKSLEKNINEKVLSIEKLKFFYINVGGLKSKMNYDDFMETIKIYDIVCIVEAKIDKNDLESLTEEFENFDIHSNILEQYSQHPRAGILILTKKHLKNFITLFTPKSNLVLFLKIDGKILNSNVDLICGSVYIPPYDSKYYLPEDFQTLQEEILEIQCKHDCDMILCGDFNAKTLTKPDYIPLEKCDETLIADFYEDIDYRRYNQDIHLPDSHGVNLLNMCKTTDLLIVNGRAGGDRKVGKFTTQNDTVIDYFLVSPTLFNEISEFEVLDFNEIISDVHCAIVTSLRCISQELQDIEKIVDPLFKKPWDPSKKDTFMANLDESKINELEISLENLSKNDDLDQNLNAIVKNLNDIFCNAHEKSFKKIQINKKFVRKKAWYDQELNTAKKIFRNARKKKDPLIKKRQAKMYKSLLSQKKFNFKSNLSARLKNQKSKDPRLFWKILNGSKKADEIDIPLEDFEAFYRNLNLKSDDDTDVRNFENDFADLNKNKNLSDILNSPISEKELQTALKNLKNNKACGVDNILNEHIKVSFEKMKNIYLKLFNFILMGGSFPEIWALGQIIPIFKKKGSKKDPGNYRGITLLSCLGKFFNIILNNRLKKVCDFILKENQAGFRKNYSTLDHALSLYFIFTLYKRMKKPLFMAFIDYAKAFDTIWRTGLWMKLLKCGIDGRFLKIVQNMYQKSKSCVLLKGERSNSFTSERGVKQGEILSPLLFAIYINDLEKHFKDEGVPSLDGIKSTNDEVNMLDGTDSLLDILTLFYADDTIIFSDTALGLQFALEELENYCRTWKLVVNEDKTKIMCINGQKSDNHSFFYNNKELEVVSQFSYLGLNFSKNGLNSNCIKDRKVKAEKSMFGTLVKCKKNELDFELCLEMFNKIVLPCILYGSEIWGFNNIIELERIQLKYIKYLLKIKQSTPSVMIYGETGVLPVEYYVKCRMIKFWLSLLTGRQSKISFKLYNICLSLFRKKLILCDWLTCIKSIIDECGMSYVFDLQETLDVKWLFNKFYPKIKNTLKDLLKQKWHHQLESEKCVYYKLFINPFVLKYYLWNLPQNLLLPFCKFRMSNHKLPVEIQSWDILYKPRELRLCLLCDLHAIGDEFHYVLKCPIFDELRKMYVPSECIDNPTIEKFVKLICTNEKDILLKVATFIKEILNVFE